MSDRELAGYVAPILRSTDERVLRRRVKTYDRETGETTGEVTMREVVGGLAQATALGLEVVEGVRPNGGVCEACGKPFEARVRGHAPRFCPPKIGGCHRQRTCANCEAVPPPSVLSAAQVRRRNGQQWRCPLCRHGAPAPPQASCANGCGRAPGRKAFSPSSVKKRGGQPWWCYPCSMERQSLTKRGSTNPTQRELRAQASERAKARRAAKAAP